MAERAKNSECPYPSKEFPINVEQWQLTFRDGHCLGCDEELGDTPQWKCCWFGRIPEMYWRLTLAARDLAIGELVKAAERAESLIKEDIRYWQKVGFHTEGMTVIHEDLEKALSAYKKVSQ